MRYRLLEIVREYANEKLAEAGEGDAARRHHRDFFLTLASTQEDPAERTRNWSTGSWIRLADTDHHNFGAALEWSFTEGDDEAALGLAAALWRYWWWARPLEGCDWLERAVAGPVETVTPERLEALIGLGVLLPRSGRAPIQKGEELLRDALRLALEAGLAGEVARARYFLGELALSRGDPVEAEPLLRAALEAFEAMDAPFSAAWCHHALGWMAMARGELRLAQDHFEYILELTRRHAAAELLRVHAVAGLAPLAALAGEPEHAEALADDGVTVARRLPAPGFLVMALTRASETALLSGRRPRPILRELLGLLDGTNHLSTALINSWMRTWIARIPRIDAGPVDEHGEPVAFDRGAIHPHAFRHTYAQTMADSGVAPSVLRDLMDHRSLSTTLGYYKVGESRKRAAMELLARHTVDNRGVARPVADAPSAVTHLREHLSWVAVPMGKCSEPTNVRAGGQACPIRYQCAGCPHFESDPSYLPELRAYADDLRRQREAMLAAGAADWAVDNVVHQLDVIVVHVRAHEQLLEGLDGEERSAIENASTTLRKTRQSVPVAFGRRREAGRG